MQPGRGQRAGDKKAARQEADQARLARSPEDVRKIVSETPRPWPPSSAPGRASDSGATEPRSKRPATSTASTPAKSAKSEQPKRNNTRQKRMNKHESATEQSAKHVNWASETDVIVRQLSDHEDANILTIL